MVRSGLVLTSGRTTLALLRFGRNIIIARLLGVEDYGVASTFVVFLSFIELAADIGLDRFIIQDRRGEDPRFVAAVYALLLMRGIALSLLLLILAGPAARLLGFPELAWAYRILAVAPLLHALAHPDMIRYQRQMRFAPMLKAEVGAVAATLFVMWPLTLWLGDYRVMLIVMLLEYGLRTLASHWLAERPLRVTWDGHVAGTALRFGWPLLLSGIVVFGTLQGDRIIVANTFGAYDLGLFSAGLTLAMAPSLLAGNVAGSFFLPLLAGVQDDNTQFQARAQLAIQLTMLAGGIVMIAFVVAGPAVFVYLFGDAYKPGATISTILGMAFAFRLIRAGPMTVVLAKGQTYALLTTNLVRVMELPIAVGLAYHGYSIITLAYAALAAEAISALFIFYFLRFRLRIIRFSKKTKSYFAILTSVTVSNIALSTAAHSVIHSSFLLISVAAIAFIIQAAAFASTLIQFRARLRDDFLL